MNSRYTALALLGLLAGSVNGFGLQSTQLARSSLAKTSLFSTVAEETIVDAKEKSDVQPPPPPKRDISELPLPPNQGKSTFHITCNSFVM
jgi:hypothetical protein